jgi:hypothetical protein
MESAGFSPARDEAHHVAAEVGDDMLMVMSIDIMDRRWEVRPIHR